MKQTREIFSPQTSLMERWFLTSHLGH